MPDDERPSLEAPRLFGRRRDRSPRKTAADPSAEASVDPAPDTTVEAEAAAGATTADDRADDDWLFADSGRDDTAVLTEPVTLAPADEDDEPAEPSPKPARARRTPRDRSVPLLPGRVAAVLTGLVVGLSLLGLTWVGFQGCEAARGTTSCGTAPGMVALIVIFVLSVAIGGFLLSRFSIPDPSATSFLGTGLTGVVYLLAVDLLDNWTVLVVVPLVTAATFLLSWWVTTTFVEID